MYAMEYRPDRPPLTDTDNLPLPGETPVQAHGSDEDDETRKASLATHGRDDEIPAFIVNVSPVGEVWRD